MVVGNFSFGHFAKAPQAAQGPDWGVGRTGARGSGVLRFSARQGMRLINEVAARLSYLAKFAQVYAAEKVDNSIVGSHRGREVFGNGARLMRGSIG